MVIGVMQTSDHIQIRHVLRDFLKTIFSSCMLYRHNAAIGTDWNLVFWDNSLYINYSDNAQKVYYANMYKAFQESVPEPDETAVFCATSGEIKCSGRISWKASYINQTITIWVWRWTFYRRKKGKNYAQTHIFFY